LIGDNGVVGREFAAHRAAATAIDDCNFISVDLLCGEQRPFAKAGCVADFLMCGIEPLEYFGLFVGNVDAGNSLRENVTTCFDRT